jgi:FkbM family methyltransferase
VALMPRGPRAAVRFALRQMPAKGEITRAVAKAPPWLKSPQVCRFLSRIIEGSDLADLGSIDTNLGIDSRCLRIGSSAPAHYFFGRPDSYAGERGALFLSLELSKRCDAFVDIGANHGYFVFFVNQGLETAVPIHYVEPDPQLFAEIESNVRRHRMVGVHGHRLAIGSKSGPAIFYTNLSDPASSSLTPMFAQKHRVQEDTVMVSSFDDFAERHALRNACVKVDIEGAEVAFLSGAKESQDRIAFLIIEVLGPAIQDGFVRMAQQALGMHAYYINDLRLEHSPDGSFVYRSPEFNWLFCRQSPAELRALLEGSRLSVA